MSIIKSISILFLVIIFISCNNDQKNNESPDVVSTEKVAMSKAQKILSQTMTAHGGDLYNSAHYSFVFRNKMYQFKNEGEKYQYSKTTLKGDTTINDVLDNGDFKRMINGKPVDLTEKEISSGAEGINSVIYFATLPYKLNDKAVNTKYIESIIIKDKIYDVLLITFNQAGGGKDHDDEYYYWINTDTKKIDYLAYNYTVNEGGVRFRSAYNTRVVDGITFQDYINYKADVGTPLKDLPALYEAGKLKELSRIETEDVINLN